MTDLGLLLNKLFHLFHLMICFTVGVFLVHCSLMGHKRLTKTVNFSRNIFLGKGQNRKRKSIQKKLVSYRNPSLVKMGNLVPNTAKYMQCYTSGNYVSLFSLKILKLQQLEQSRLSKLIENTPFWGKGNLGSILAKIMQSYVS